MISVEGMEIKMIVYKNRKSGRGFILVESNGEGRAFFVTPQAQVKPLELRLFSAVEEDSEQQLLAMGLITEEQRERHRATMNARMDLEEKRKRARFQRGFEKMTLKEKAACINGLPSDIRTKLIKAMDEVTL
jgi:hypothetical protein